ncbi:MAG: cytochrome c oxidase subunit II [Deltaproteobacteria bacterium]|nr:cytochrome c oxidase subunit II [Deltaproteobacteria bacterium]MCL5277221.1 cytochrome c oxidase subunit II [Deltaproteobacteria bacterium]
MLPDASNIAKGVDGVLLFIVITGIVIIGIVTFFMIFFSVTYNKRRHPEPDSVQDSTVLEIVWTVVPIGIVLVMFYLGWKNYKFIQGVPKNAMTVRVTGRQWSWLFTYANGKNSGILELPVGKPVKLDITSADVIHGFFIPAFRIKQDAVPGVVNSIWFIPDKTGTYEILCTVYCGIGHAHMLSKAVIVPEADFDTWYNEKQQVPVQANAAAARGEGLIKQYGCTGCHTVDGSPLVGPTYKGLYNSRITVITNGKERTVTADDAYIKLCILDPGVNLVKGFPPHVMPSFKGRLTGRDIREIIAYVKTLK